jgi:colicin import membrane protein
MTIATAMALSASTATPILADPASNPGHALAQRFAEDAERARAAEAARRDAARKATDLRRKEQADKVARVQAQKKWEAEMLARAKAEAEDRRQLEAEAARLDAARIAREVQEAETARRIAETVRAADEAARTAEDMRRTAETLRLAAERTAADEARKAAEIRRFAEEKELEARRIEAVRLAEEARRAQNARLAEEGRRAEAERGDALRKAEASARLAEEARRAEQAARTAEEMKRAEAQRRAAEDAQLAIKRATDAETRRVGDLEAAAETERVAARLRAIRDEHLARHMPGDAPRDAGAPPAGEHVPSGGIGRLAVPPAPDMPRTAPSPDVHRAADAPPSRYNTPSRALSHTHDGRVTILLQMEAREQHGRRHESMDPVLCVTDGCYVSNGPEHPASFLPGRRATRFGNAISRRAGACNHAYTCVFRDVEIGALPAEVQPVDIRILRHDRRAPESVETMSTCRGTPGRLACTGAIKGDGYTMWVIPESVAARLPVELFGITADGGTGHDPRSAMAPIRGRW